MKLFKRILGICETRPPHNSGAWNVSGGKVNVSLEKIPELLKPGGAVRLEGKGLSGKILLVHGADGQFHAFDNKCTHMGRRMDPVTGTDTIQCCSVSLSTFNYSGEVISGPAKAPLDVLNVQAEAEHLIITLDCEK